MDSVNILRKLQEIEHLKKIVLNDKQYALFHYLSKPMIKTSNNANSPENIPLFNSSTSEVSNILEELKNDSENNIVNANLIKLIDQNMKGFNLKVEMKA